MPRIVDVDVVRVLIVEDNDVDAGLVELMLRSAFGADVEVLRARTLAEAFACVERGRVGCVLLDLGLPDADGIDTVQAMTQAAPTTPVVVLTADGDAERGVSAVVAGAQDYLVKGKAVPETLERAVRYAVVRKRAEDALWRGEQTLAEAQRIAHLGSWELDLATDTMVCSVELCRLYGYAPSAIPGMGHLIGRTHPDDRAHLASALRIAASTAGSFDLDHRVVLPDGATRWLRSQGRVEVGHDGVPVRMMGTAQDITERKNAEEALAHQALHDALTGLPNRVLLLDRLTQALARLDREHSAVALLFVDIDRFKVVNDSLGHAAGDQMLLAMARRLEDTMRAGDTLARFGGDEFVVLCEGLSGEVEALGMADRIGETMAQPLSWGGGELVVTVSIGIGLATSPLVSADSLLRDADAAMYRAKDDGRARAAVFAESMRAKAIGRLDTEVSLRRGLECGEFELHYQPIVELPSRRVTGMEALVRWRHPTRGLILPDQFIPIAEETGLIVPLGAWALRQAARQAKAWQQRPEHASMSMAVNLSACQVTRPDLADMVAVALDESGVEPHCLQIEITESVLMKDAATAVQMLGALKALGVRLSIDDFGTGYSSLSYLKRFPVDELKIDRSFVDGLGEDPEDSAIVKAITSLATSLNLALVAEGVETRLQMESLLDLGCYQAQGHYFAPAAPAAEIDAILDRPLATTAP